MFKQVELNYEFKDMEPHIDEVTMKTHYSKHHAAYTTNFNDAVSELGWEDKKVEDIFLQLDKIDDLALRNKTQNNGGGYYNHNMYFTTMTPGGSELEGKLSEQINKDFGSLENLKEKLTSAAMSVFGSGWAWLSKDEDDNLKVTITSNQDNPIITSKGRLQPILGIDVWEHAYYLKHKNLRAEYLKDFMDIICWKTVSENYNNL